MEQPYACLEDVVSDGFFPAVDSALRIGRHVDQEDFEHYTFLSDAQPWLEPFYERYGYELVRAADGYFFLVPAVERLPRRHMTVGEMVVGQGLALLFLDPSTLKAAGVVDRMQLVQLLANLIGEERLSVAINPRRKRRDEKVEQAIVRKELDRALRTLAALGFVDLLEEERIRLRAPLLRFAEPVREQDDPIEALGRMVARGQAAVEPGVEGAGVEAGELVDDEEGEP